MTAPVDALLGRPCEAVGEKTVSSNSATSDRQRLQRLASEFESMLLNPVLQEMRRAGRWDDGQGDDEGEGKGLGNGALFEILDAELAKQLSESKGFGLSRQLMDAFDRLQGTSVDAAVRPVGASSEGAPVSGVPVPTGRASDRESGIPDPGSDLPAAMAAAGRQVTSGFGWRRDPFTGETRLHRGVDLRAAYGEDISAAAAGRVAFSGAQGTYGNTVVVEHANGTRTRYAHLSVTLVQEGDTVEPGEVVGRAGSSGRATAPHLHLEVTDRHGRHLDPSLPLDQHD